MTSKRLETGVIRDGEDWPGIFIRGDNGELSRAIRFAISVLNDKDAPSDHIWVATKSLGQQLDFLESCYVDPETRGANRTDIQVVKVV